MRHDEIESCCFFLASSWEKEMKNGVLANSCFHTQNF